MNWTISVIFFRVIASTGLVRSCFGSLTTVWAYPFCCTVRLYKTPVVIQLMRCDFRKDFQLITVTHLYFCCLLNKTSLQQATDYLLCECPKWKSVTSTIIDLKGMFTPRCHYYPNKELQSCTVHPNMYIT